jgi:hypothetical protein
LSLRKNCFLKFPRTENAFFGFSGRELIVGGERARKLKLIGVIYANYLAEYII